MYCSHCGMKLPDWAHYCERCGTRVHRVTDDVRYRQETSSQDSHVSGENVTAWEDAGSDEFTVNDAIRQELDNLAEPMPLDDHGQPVRSGQEEGEDSPELTVNDAIKQELDKLFEPTPTDAPTGTEAYALDAVEGASRPAGYAEESGTSNEPSGAVGSSYDQAIDAAVDKPEDGALRADYEGLEESERLSDDHGAEEPKGQDGVGGKPSDSDSQEGSGSPKEDESSIWSTQQFERIDVGEDDLPAETYVPTYHRNEEERRRVQETFANQRVSGRHLANSPRLSRPMLTAITISVVMLIFLLTYPVLDWAMQGSVPVQQEKTVQPRIVSERRAKKIVRSLEGWWTTNRTFDGRFWRVKNGVLETYAADGNLTKKRKIRLDEIEVKREAPEGLEGKGYYLRSIGFFLLDSDFDTLHAINDEGELAKDANLVRTDKPSFTED